MLTENPTLADLKRAYRDAGLWRLGMSFRQAVACPLTLKGLANCAKAERRRIEQHQGKPAPVQPALFERTA